MFTKNLLLLLTLAVISRKGYVYAKPCFGFDTILESMFDDDSDEDDPPKPPATAFPPKITVVLTPVTDLATFQAMNPSPSGSILLLPSLFPFQQAQSSSSTTTSTTTTTTTAAPAAAAAPAGAKPATPAAGAATPAPAAAG